MVTLPELQTLRDALFTARLNGLRSVRDSSGETVEYKSDTEMARALAAVDREISALTTERQSSTVRFSTSKGL